VRPRVDDRVLFLLDAAEFFWCVADFDMCFSKVWHTTLFDTYKNSSLRTFHVA
jgi:hypothetical protein